MDEERDLMEIEEELSQAYAMVEAQGESEGARSQRLYIRSLTRLRDDVLGTRKRLDNRLGVKADGKSPQELVEERRWDLNQRTFLQEQRALQAVAVEQIERELTAALKLMPIYSEYLARIDGIGPVSAGWIVGEFDIRRAATVSKLWQFAGLNPGMVAGKVLEKDEAGQPKRDKKTGRLVIRTTETMIRGDRLKEGFIAPFNGRLRAALVGVMADVWVRGQNRFVLQFYYPYKARLEQEARLVEGRDPEKAKPWSAESKGHRDRAAKRYMIKCFLRELYVAWRTLEGLPVRAPYSEEYLGRTHVA